MPPSWHRRGEGAGLERGVRVERPELPAQGGRGKSTGPDAPGEGVLSTKEGQSGRGERDSPATTDLPITMRLAEPPEPFDWLESA